MIKWIKYNGKWDSSAKIDTRSDEELIRVYCDIHIRYGLRGVQMIAPEELPIVKKHELTDAQLAEMTELINAKILK